jgi:hypothetical protein
VKRLIAIVRDRTRASRQRPSRRFAPR